MFTQIRLSNFKGFAESHNLDLSKVNLFYGANSAGKSAILEALLLISQSIRRSSALQEGSEEPLLFNGSHVDLGSFQVSINGHNVNKTLSLGVSYQIRRKVDDDAFLDDIQHFDVDVTWNHELKAQVVEKCVYRIDSSPENTILFKKSQNKNGDFSLRPVRADGFQNIVEIVSNFTAWRLPEQENIQIDIGEILLLANYENWSFLPGIPPITSRPFPTLKSLTSRHGKDDDDSGVEEEVVDPEVRSEILRNLFEDMALRQWRTMLEERYRDTFEKLSTIRYLGPMRKPPTRVERLADNSSTYVGKEGDGVASILHRNPAIVTKINNYLRELAMPYQLIVRKLDTDGFGTTGEILAIQLVDLRSNVVLSLEDVGFGVSQILPVLAQLAISKGDLILIEQPELHLHPAVQANLADLLIDGTYEQEPNQFFIETHSEHLMLRLQRRIREGRLSAEDVSVFFIDASNNNGSIVRKLDLDKHGEFMADWPGGFFPERLDELLS